MKITREQIVEMINEAMGSMMDMPMSMPMDMDMGSAMDPHGDVEMHHGGRGGHKGAVSREDCCAAIMCLVECCSCPVTSEAIMRCCDDIMAGHYDRQTDQI